MDMVHLIGAEQVERAAHAIRSAAETMERAAAIMDAAVDRLARGLDDAASRIERALEIPVSTEHPAAPSSRDGGA